MPKVAKYSVLLGLATSTGNQKPPFSTHPPHWCLIVRKVRLNNHLTNVGKNYPVSLYIKCLLECKREQENTAFKNTSNQNFCTSIPNLQQTEYTVFIKLLHGNWLPQSIQIWISDSLADWAGCVYYYHFLRQVLDRDLWELAAGHLVCMNNVPPAVIKEKLNVCASGLTYITHCDSLIIVFS